MVDARERLEGAGLPATGNRLLVLQALEGLDHPQTPQELLIALTGSMNRVTLYRILELFVARGLAARHKADGRAYR